MKKILAVFLILSLTLTVLALPAFADNRQSGRPGQGQQAGPGGSFSNGQVPGNGHQPGQGMPPQGAPDQINFETLLQNGVIDQTTYDAIIAYIQANQPTGAPDGTEPPEMPDADNNGNPPALPGDNDSEITAPAAPGSDGNTPPEGPDGGDSGMTPPENGLIRDLVNAGILTQEQADAITAWMTTETPVTASDETASDVTNT